jgi:redox-sensing transcriptional repressor
MRTLRGDGEPDQEGDPHWSPRADHAVERPRASAPGVGGTPNGETGGGRSGSTDDRTAGRRRRASPEFGNGRAGADRPIDRSLVAGTGSGVDLGPDAAGSADLADPRGRIFGGEAGAPETGPIPDIVIRRLPVYVRTLRDLRDRGVASVSSDELAHHIGVTAAQIRRDLSYFGKFGKQGKGYDTGFLADAIVGILGLDRQWDVALAGLGNLGRAIARYRGFAASSFNIVALFDRNPEQAGREVQGLPVLGEERITETVRARGIRIGIVAVPAGEAQAVADAMVAGGVRALLNYAPVVLKVPAHVTVREIDPVGALQSMTYYLESGEDR